MRGAGGLRVSMGGLMRRVSRAGLLDQMTSAVLSLHLLYMYSQPGLRSIFMSLNSHEILLIPMDILIDLK